MRLLIAAAAIITLWLPLADVDSDNAQQRYVSPAASGVIISLFAFAMAAIIDDAVFRHAAAATPFFTLFASLSLD